MTEVLRKPDGVIVIDPAGVAAHIPQEQIIRTADEMVRAWYNNKEEKPFSAKKAEAAKKNKMFPGVSRAFIIGAAVGSLIGTILLYQFIMGLRLQLSLTWFPLLLLYEFVFAVAGGKTAEQIEGEEKTSDAERGGR